MVKRRAPAEENKEVRVTATELGRSTPPPTPARKSASRATRPSGTTPGDAAGADRLGHGALRCAADRWCGTAREDAEMSTGEARPGEHPARLCPERPGGRGAWSRVNDYLAKRDADGWVPSMSSMARAWIASTGTSPTARSVARPTWPTSPTERTTNSDSTTCATTWRMRPPPPCSAKHHYAIVDEVDSVLIDDARRRSSSPVPRPRARCTQFVSTNPGRAPLHGPAQTGHAAAHRGQEQAQGPGKTAVLPRRTAGAGWDGAAAPPGTAQEQRADQVPERTGVKALLQKTEAHYLQDQARRCRRGPGATSRRGEAQPDRASPEVGLDLIRRRRQRCAVLHHA